ncbi:hypothetical protein D9757_011997 [Collybiopsis confluens]|uniref:CCHC-type domain-containing protein n=1 Tax=Collybiopsis confluens TaxID=2823264 RepID=A0A8H5GRL8_9AGAR|nr:hypothetical protein D9757_011997 [Collybiopsis confluens]
MSTSSLSKLPLRGSGKGPKFPEDANGIEVHDYIEEVEELVADVPAINTDQEKKDALLRYLPVSMKRIWRAISGYDAGDSYDKFRKNILSSYDHTEIVSVKGLKAMLKKYLHVRVTDLDRVLDLRREIGPYIKGLFDLKKVSNREMVQMLFETIDEDFSASVWKKLARSQLQKATTPSASGHVWSVDDPIGLGELLEELELQARLSDSKNRVMGPKFGNHSHSKSNVEHEVRVKEEQRESDLAQLKDVFALVQKEGERRHREMLDSMMKMHQEVLSQKVTSSYQPRSYSNNMSSSQGQSGHFQGKSSRDTDGMVRDIICWFCGEAGHLSGRCMVRQKYLDEGKIILRGTNVCMPSGQVVYYTTGKDCQKMQVDQAIRDTKQSNLLREVLSEEDLASTPLEELEAYVVALKERKRMTSLIQQLRLGDYNEEDEQELQAVNAVQTRAQRARNSNSENVSGPGF